MFRHEDDRNEQWFEQLWHKHNQSVYKICAALLRVHAAIGDHQAEAKDMTQLTFQTAWLSRHKVPDDEPAVWLHRTARNHCRNLVRKLHSGRIALTDPDTLKDLAGAGHEDELRMTPERVDLHNNLAKMSPADRDLLIETYWTDSSPTELAKTYGIKAAAVRVRQTRARRNFRKVARDTTTMMPPPATDQGR